ncbi:hypothetical protein MKX03_019483, partial [Papaver bracteatum]
MVYILVWGPIDLIVYCGVGDATWRASSIPKGIVDGKSAGSLIFFKEKLFVLSCVYHFELVIETKRRRSGDIGLRIGWLEVSNVHSEYPYIGGLSCV